MYEEYYGLTANPFRLTPDQKFWYGSEGHQKAMSYLKYGLYQGEGFIVVTGDVGTGKSTLVGQLFSELDGNDIVAAQIGNTQLDADDAIRLICAAFEIEADTGDKGELIAMFEEFLIAQNQMGRRVLLVVDEAQNMPVRALEELRMLSNFNVNGTPLFQIFLIGQPQFLQTLGHRDLAQLQQRVIASYKLESMSREETEEYIFHRLGTVGWQGVPTFTDDAFDIIHANCNGVPRLINTLSNRLMLFASLEEADEIDGDMVKAVIEDQKSESIETAAKEQSMAEAARVATEAPVATAAASTAAAAAAMAPSAASAAADMGAVPADRFGRVERAVAVLVNRLERLEERVGEHDDAIHELIDLAMNAYGVSEEDDEESLRSA